MSDILKIGEYVYVTTDFAFRNNLIYLMSNILNKS